MRLEDYFDFQRPDHIRIAGTRVGIETVLDEYRESGKTAEEIANAYSSLTLEQVYATILYYLQNRESVDRYMGDWIAHCRESEAAYDANPPDLGRTAKRAPERKPAVRAAS
jgi:uncharacterized protein (DUF433 family)